jgi:hypothetical protein
MSRACHTSVACGPVSVEPETWAGIKAQYR